jgi:hypothetical protein
MGYGVSSKGQEKGKETHVSPFPLSLTIGLTQLFLAKKIEATTNNKKNTTKLYLTHTYYIRFLGKLSLVYEHTLDPCEILQSFLLLD